MSSTDKIWHYCGIESDFPKDGGAAVLIENKQIAIFNFDRRKEWYATDNECPHKKQMILARGMIGSEKGIPKVACPFHKRTFSLVDGKCLNDDTCQIDTYPIKVEENKIYIQLT